MKSTIHYRTLSYLNGVDLLTCRGNDHHFPKHFHDGYNIWLNSAGGESVWHKGNSNVLQQNDIGVVNPGEVHANHGVNDDRCLQSFYISPAAMKRYVQHLHSDMPVEFHQMILTDAPLKNDMMTLHQMLQQAHDPLEGESLLLLLMDQLFSKCTDQKRTRSSEGCLNKVELVKEFLHAHFDEDLRLDQLSAVADVSSHHLIRTFKKVVGMPPHQYLIQLRLQHVAGLLKTGKYRISDVAVSAGFSDQSHMHRHFKRLYGIAPAAYQKHISASFSQ